MLKEIRENEAGGHKNENVRYKKYNTRSNIHTLYNPAIPLLGICQENLLHVYNRKYEQESAL